MNEKVFMMSYNEEEKQTEKKKKSIEFGFNKIIGVLIIAITILLYISLLSR